jgi:membrane protein implicated in regulation of membrane protease activity
MTVSAFFLGCFVIGFLLSTFAFALTAVDMAFHLHIPFVHHLHLPHPHDVPHLHAPHPTVQAGAHLGAHAPVSPVNFPTLMAFLAWFGGTGYLLTSRFSWLMVPALAVSTFAGLAGALIVFWLMAHVLWSPREHMQSVDYNMVGVLGRLSQPIRTGGTGELIYTLGGSRKSCGARSADGTAIGKGTEVIVTAYDRGIAYVRGWDDLAGEKS